MEYNTENVITPDNSLPEGDELTPADGNGAASQQVGVKNVLSELLGKKFDTDEVALKSVKDTYKMVGTFGKARQILDTIKQEYDVDEEGAIKIMEQKVSEPRDTDTTKEQQVDLSKFVSKDEFAKEMFFKDHPEMTPYKSILDSVARAQNKPISEVAEFPEVKDLITKSKAYDDQESAKSVLMSNPRLGQATDNLSRAREALASGNDVAAREGATKAVMDLMSPNE